MRAKSSSSRRSYSDFNNWPNDLKYESRISLCSRIIFTKLELRQLIRSWLTAFVCCWYVMSLDDLDLLPLGPLWYIGCDVCKVYTYYEQNRTIHDSVIDNLVHFAVVMSHYHLDLWPLDLERKLYIRCYVLKLGTKCQRNSSIRGWVIVDLLSFSSLCVNVNGVENPGYFCTLTPYRPSWIWQEVDFQNSSVYGTSWRTSL